MIQPLVQHEETCYYYRMAGSRHNQLGSDCGPEQEAAEIAELISSIREAALQPYSQAAEQHRDSSPGVSENVGVNGLPLSTLPGAPTVGLFSVKAGVKEIYGPSGSYEHASMYWYTEHDSISIHLGRDLETGEVTSELDLSNRNAESVTVKNPVLMAAVLGYARATLDLLAQLETPQS